MTQPRQFICTIFTIVMLALGTPPTPAQSQGFGAVDTIPGGIHMVMSGGYWSLGSDEGFFRVIVTAGGVEHVSHRLYIQWLKADAATQSYQPVRTIAVKELDLGHGYVLNVNISFGDMNAFLINVNATSRGDKPRSFAIIAKNDGTYTIAPR